MAIQDESRENELIELFGLERPENSSRGGTDAIMRLDRALIPFELKSTGTKSVTTVRDFGPDHIAKWVGKHWLVGFYDATGKVLQKTLYGAPLTMEPWITGMQNYIAPDFALADMVPSRIMMSDLVKLFGQKNVYALAEAQRIQKRQLTISEYQSRMDRSDGFSPQAMLEMLRDRCKYIVERGATLNNPHINESYFTDEKSPGTDRGGNSWRTVNPRDPVNSLRNFVEEAIGREASIKREMRATLAAEETEARREIELDLGQL